MNREEDAQHCSWPAADATRRDDEQWLGRPRWLFGAAEIGDEAGVVGEVDGRVAVDAMPCYGAAAADCAVDSSEGSDRPASLSLLLSNFATSFVTFLKNPLYSATYITLFIFSAMSNVGIPIKLLFEAEGMKVTVEVGVF